MLSSTVKRSPVPAEQMSQDLAKGVRLSPVSLMLRRVSPGKVALVQAVSSVCGTLAVCFLVAPGSLLYMYFKDFKSVTEEILAPFHFAF